MSTKRPEYKEVHLFVPEKIYIEIKRNCEAVGPFLITQTMINGGLKESRELAKRNKPQVLDYSNR